MTSHFILTKNMETSRLHSVQFRGKLWILLELNKRKPENQSYLKRSGEPSEELNTFFNMAKSHEKNEMCFVYPQSFCL